ncbi:hypothetical protein B0H11DRAFT_1953157 [Mycena galericulata]|nr:hypothetical protein B0H11DRAFT_1953157 [Mycena galericulata]
MLNIFHPVSRLLNPLEDLPSEADILRLKALSILSPEQQQLCRALVDAQEPDNKRNILHHPRPDRDTAMDRLAEFLDEEARHAFEKYLKTDPQRLSYRREQNQPFGGAADLYLFAEAGQYTNVATKKADLEDLKAEKVEMTMYLEAFEQEGT